MDVFASQYSPVWAGPGRSQPFSQRAGRHRAPAGSDQPGKARAAASDAQGSSEVSGHFFGGGQFFHGHSSNGGEVPPDDVATTAARPENSSKGAAVHDVRGYGYRGRHVPASERDPLFSNYHGFLPGVIRSAFELWEKLNGRSVDYLRAPVDQDKQDNLRKHLLAQLAKDRMR